MPEIKFNLSTSAIGLIRKIIMDNRHAVQFHEREKIEIQTSYIYHIFSGSSRSSKNMSAILELVNAGVFSLEVSNDIIYIAINADALKMMHKQMPLLITGHRSIEWQRAHPSTLRAATPPPSIGLKDIELDFFMELGEANEELLDGDVGEGGESPAT